MSLEELLRGIVTGLLLPTLALAAVTLPFREPSPRIQTLQVAHAYLGLLLVPAGLAYLLTHLFATVDWKRARRRLRAPRAPSPRAASSRAWPWLAAGVCVTSITVALFMTPLVRAYREATSGAARGVGLELRYLLAVGNATALAVIATAWALTRHGLAPFNLRWIAAAAATACAATGFWVTIVPPKALAHVDVLAVAHTLLGPLALLLVGAHVMHARRVAARRAPGDASPSYRWRRPLFWVALPTAAVASFVVVGLPILNGPRFERSAADPRMIRPVDAHFAELAPAGCVSCHGGESETWSESAHARAAANPVFEALLRSADRAGRGDVVRWCLGCHAPHALDPNRASIDEVVASDGFRAGVHCMSCHRADDVSARGDGGLEIRPLAADGFMFIQDLPGFEAIRRGYTPYALIASRLPQHRRAFHFHSREAVVCRPCHVQTLSIPTGGRLSHVLQDQFASWERSSAAAHGEECRDCHMPVYRNPFGLRVVDHRMLGASTYLARQAEGDAGLATMSEWLRGEARERARTGLDRPSHQSGPILDIATEIVGQPSQPRLRVRTRNSGRLGHSFPNGPTDLFDVWLSARVADRGGARELLSIGESGPEGAPALGDRLRSANGDTITDHRLWDVERVEDLGRIPSDGDHTLELDLPAVLLEPPVEVHVAWHYRRLSAQRTEALTGTRVELPAIELARFDGAPGYGTVPIAKDATWPSSGSDTHMRP